MDQAPVLVMVVIVVVIAMPVLVGVLRAVEMLVNVQVGEARSWILFDAHHPHFSSWTAYADVV
jgi:hypothetical protein